jgi:hypothetical protein
MQLAHKLRRRTSVKDADELGYGVMSEMSQAISSTLTSSSRPEFGNVQRVTGVHYAEEGMSRFLCGWFQGRERHYVQSRRRNQARSRVGCPQRDPDIDPGEGAVMPRDHVFTAL